MMSYKLHMMLTTILSLQGIKEVDSREHGDSSEGPKWKQEPSYLNYFMHSEGIMLDCIAEGYPEPLVTWHIMDDSRPISNVARLREIYVNGSLHLYPFDKFDYHPQVHNQSYYCTASNSFGTLRSRDIMIIAVIKEDYNVRVQSTAVVEGNDALVECMIPSSAQHFMSVTSWIKDSTMNIFPHGGTDGRFRMLPTGELYVLNVTESDSFSSLQCRMVNRLTGTTQLSFSNSLTLIQKEKLSTQKSPKIRKSSQPISIWKKGSNGVLICIFSGTPPFAIRWVKKTDGREFSLIRSNERYHIHNSVLVIENVGHHDSGVYACLCNNTIGSERQEFNVVVRSSLDVRVVPSSLTVDMGHKAEFTCWTNLHQLHYRLGMPKVAIKWTKNGLGIINSRSHIRISISSDKLYINSVGQEDQGIYQCFVQYGEEMSQSSGHLRLGDLLPQLAYRFIEQTLRPGPTVSLKCSAKGNPTPRITWLLDGFELASKPSILMGQYVTMKGEVVSHVNITSVQVNDGGLYQCKASNDVGQAFHSARLNIYGAPFIRNFPDPIKAVSGKDFSIKCPVSGFPISNITWSKNGELLPLSRRQTVRRDGSLTIRDVDKGQDTGVYSCSAYNKQGESHQRSINLKVVVPPKIIPFNFPERVVQGERILVTCVVKEGDEPLKVRWLKNGKTLEKLREDDKSSLSTYPIGDWSAVALQIKNVRSQDSGYYTCLASNTGGNATYTLQLKVHVAPKINPFTFPPNVREGRRVQVICSLSEGDVDERNMTISWFKDSNNIKYFENDGEDIIKVFQVDPFSAMLSIPSASSSHTGNYTCQISSLIDTVSYTASLIVHVPPKWIEEPGETMVQQGEILKITCAADGFPKPNVTWKKSIDKAAQSYQDILSYHHKASEHLTRVDKLIAFSNGTLFVQRARKNHEGTYLCEASNQVGSPLSKLITIKVNVPVSVTALNKSLSVGLGGKAQLSCIVHGDPPFIDLQWRKGSRTIFDNGLYSISSMNETGTVITTLRISLVSKKDNGMFHCSAHNTYSSDQDSIMLRVLQRPTTPQDLHVITKGSRFVTLGWSQGPNETTDVTSYVVAYHRTSGSAKIKVKTNGPVPTVTVEDLLPFTEYLFSVTAENEIGESGSSQPLSVRMEGEAPQSSPIDVQAVPISSHKIEVMWKSPNFNINNNNNHQRSPLGYKIGYKVERDDEQEFAFNELKPSGGGDNRNSIVLNNLEAYTSYEIIVQAYNEIGHGPFSKPILVITDEDVPSSAPNDLDCSTLSSQKIMVQWSPLKRKIARGVIQYYQMLYEPYPPKFTDQVVVLESLNTTVVLNQLEKYTNYSMQVQGFTKSGGGPISDPIFCKTLEDVPEAPKKVKALVSSPTSVIISWLPPSLTNGRLLEYKLSYKEPKGYSKAYSSTPIQLSISSDITYYEVDGLRTGKKYEFHVLAATIVGDGPAAVVSALVNSHVRPAIVSFGMTVLKSWKEEVVLPCVTVGYSIGIKWTREAEISNGNFNQQDGSLVLRSLKRSDTGNYTCSIERHGRLLPDSITHSLVVLEPPGSPSLLVKDVTYSSIGIRWDVSDHGGSPILGYLLHIKSNEEWTEKKIHRHHNSYQLQRLECGTAHEVYLAAYNKVGSGRASNVVKASTLGSTPKTSFSFSSSAPLFIHPNQTSARIDLQEIWSSNGCAIKSFEVLYRQESSLVWHKVAQEIEGEEERIYLNGLLQDTTYQVKVKALNGAGSSQAQFTFSTLSSHSGKVEQEAKTRGYMDTGSFFSNVNIILSIVVSTVSLIVIAVGVCICVREKMWRHVNHRREDNCHTPPSSKRNPSEDFLPNSICQKSTPRRFPIHLDSPGSDEVNPYATFEITPKREFEYFRNPPCINHPGGYQEPHLKTQYHCPSGVQDAYDSDEERLKIFGQDGRVIENRYEVLPKRPNGMFMQGKLDRDTYKSSVKRRNKRKGGSYHYERDKEEVQLAPPYGFEDSEFNVPLGEAMKIQGIHKSYFEKSSINV